MHTTQLTPLATQVMKEDGIEINDYHAIDFKKLHTENYSVIVSLTKIDVNNSMLPTDYKSYTLQNPLDLIGYDHIVNCFREVREEIKKIAIEVVGEQMGGES